MTGMRFQTAPNPVGRGQPAVTYAPSTEGQMNKFNLQILMGLVGIIPVATGLLGMMGVDDPVYVAAGVPPIVLLDTNLRFFAGAWVGLGLALYWLIPTIERQTVLFRALGHDLHRRHRSPSSPLRGLRSSVRRSSSGGSPECRNTN
jgi:Domain of unknown function (DUF4345)